MLEFANEIMRLKVKAPVLFLDLGQQRRAARLQHVDRAGIGVIEDEQAFDVEQWQALPHALEINRREGGAKLLDQNDRRAGRTALISARAGESIDDGQPEFGLLRQLTAQPDKLARRFAQDLVLPARVLFERRPILPMIWPRDQCELLGPRFPF